MRKINNAFKIIFTSSAISKILPSNRLFWRAEPSFIMRPGAQPLDDQSVSKLGLDLFRC